ncbi:putative 2-hydroxyacid dehydrogenase SAUSA300_2254 isoform X2 [Dunckerocampus dactyliophorus]|uniref:putative 2-hydroxyacid dehydrogenase SAUSA300_2254 isoform X2 n=1 Tax=Dunckerocampus dactyliophorus TaxID=161453 RepID=UPI002405998B|nr:putative 2-hydroxyacid dehydrogenase SAUSA300_2254 isoform X2 [Dunckerocampus dactyliophorus]
MQTVFVQSVRILWGPVQASRSLQIKSVQRSVHQHKKMMDNDKPWALISEVGEQGILEEAMDLLRQHFQLVLHQDFLRDPQLHGPKIQVLFQWLCAPQATPALLSSLPALKLIASGGADYDHLDLPYVTSLGLKVANTPGVVSDCTADMAMGLLLASARTIVEGHQRVMDPETTCFPQWLGGVEVTGSTLGIIGMGKIGEKIAQRAKGFDMNVLYYNRNRRSVEVEEAVAASYCQNMDDLLMRSDFVMLAVCLTPDTTGLISTRELGLMKPTATLISISRGPVVDQDALVEALQARTIRGAALDVTYPEPLPRDHPLIGLPNVVITPHFGTSTIATIKRMVQKMVENALAAMKGESIPDEVKC